ncbi:MAG: hypothetical protein IID45_00305 [Planctomycetes bacterium]|nr:hypothetical protein [Planctomycetota bacterium]
MRKSTFAILFVLALAAAFFKPSPLTAAGREGDALLKLVADDAGLCIQLNNLDSQLTKFHRSEMFRRLTKTSLYKSWRSGSDFQNLEKAVAQIESLTGKPLRRTAGELFGRSVVLAVYPRAESKPIGVLITRASSPKQLQDALDVWKRAAPRDVLTVVPYRGHRYTRRTSKKPEQPEGKTVYYVVLDDVFALSDRESAIQQLIRLANLKPATTDGKNAGRRGESALRPLLDLPKYRAARRSLTGRPVATLFFNPRAWDAVVNIQQDGTGKNPVLTFLWKHCRSVIVGVRMERGIVAEVIADFSGKEMPLSWRRFVRRTSGSGEFLSRVPARALLAISGRFDSSLLTDLIRADAKKNPQWEEARKYGRALFSGLDVFDDVLPNVKENMGLFIVPKPVTKKDRVPFDALMAMEIAALSKSSPAAVRRFRERLEKGLSNGLAFLTTLYNIKKPSETPATVQSETRNGTRIRWIDRVGDFQPAVALTANNLVVAGSPRLIREFLAPAEKAALLVASDDFRHWRQMYFPGDNQIVFLNLRLLREHLRSHRGFLLQWFSKTQSVPAKTSATRLNRVLDLLQVFDGAFLAARVDEKRVHLVIGGVLSKPVDAKK